MKKLLLILPLILIICSCSNENLDGVDLEIKEKMFVTQINEIYANTKDYLGKTLMYEGIFGIYNYEDIKKDFYYVYRNGPGCCVTDAQAGFEVVYDKDYPKENDWVRVIGKLDYCKDKKGVDVLCIKATSIKKMKTRGKEIVVQ